MEASTFDSDSMMGLSQCWISNWFFFSGIWCLSFPHLSKSNCGSFGNPPIVTSQSAEAQRRFCGLENWDPIATVPQLVLMAIVPFKVESGFDCFRVNSCVKHLSTPSYHNGNHSKVMLLSLCSASGTSFTLSVESEVKPGSFAPSNEAPAMDRDGCHSYPNRQQRQPQLFKRRGKTLLTTNPNKKRSICYRVHSWVPQRWQNTTQSFLACQYM